jgi:tetratricopeptide (TPR) repeat protein
MEVNKASALLHRLVDRGAVMIVNDSGRKKLYQAAERLYNIYYLMRRRGHPSNLVRAAVIFMVQFYEGEDLVKSTARIAEEAFRLDPERHQDLYWAYQEIVNSAPEPELKIKIVQATPGDFFKTSDIPDSVRDLANLLTVQQPRRPYEAQTGVSSEKGAALIVEPQNASAWVQRGDALQKEPARLHEAEQAYREALKLNPQHPEAWAGLGQLLHEHLARYDEAEQAYRKAVELRPSYDWGWAHLGQLLHEYLARYDEAEQAYRKAVKLEPDVAWGWAHLGRLLHRSLKRYDEAEQAYLTAIELQDRNSWVWPFLIELRLARGDDTQTVYRQAQQYLERSERTAENLSDLAWVFYEAGLTDYLEDAEVWAREAVDKKADDWNTLHTLITILGARGKWKEALELAPPLLAAAATEEEAVRDATDFLISAAAAGYAKEALKLVTESKAADALEPLAVGLRIFLNERPYVAQEIFEVGQDVAQRIRELQQGKKVR